MCVCVCVCVCACMHHAHNCQCPCIAITVGSVFEQYEVTTDFTATSDEHLSVHVGETVSVISKDSSGGHSSLYT